MMTQKIFEYSVLASFLALVGYAPVANAQMKLRAPIRTWEGAMAREYACPCPYDQLASYEYIPNLAFPDYVEECQGLSAYFRPGGWEPACYVEDMPTYQGREQQREVEQWCRENRQVCYLDVMNRF